MANKGNHIVDMLSTDMPTNVNNQQKKQAPQAPPVVAPGAGAAARMGAGNGKKNNKDEACSQNFVPGMETEQSVAAKKKTRSNHDNRSPETLLSLSEAVAAADDPNRSVNALDGKLGFVSSIERYNTLVGSPLSPLSPDESIPDGDDSDVKSISEMSSIQTATPFDISSLTDEQLGFAIVNDAETLSELIPPDAIPFVEAILENLRRDMFGDQERTGFEDIPEELINHDPLPPQPYDPLPPQPSPLDHLFVVPPGDTPLDQMPTDPWQLQPREVAIQHQHQHQQQEVAWQQQQQPLSVPFSLKSYDPQMLHALISMGFPKNRSIRALLATESQSMDEATDYVIAFGDQPGTRTDLACYT